MAEASTNLGRVSLVPRGTYDPTATYDRLDIVEYGGSSYLVLMDGVTGVKPGVCAAHPQGSEGAAQEPGAGAVYMLLAKRGADGLAGQAFTYADFTPEQLEALRGPIGPQGEDGKSFTILGRYDTLAELHAAHPAGSEGEAWAVGSAEDNVIYLWNVDTQAWDNIGRLQGAPGPVGAEGKSAYQYAVDGGYTGTEEEFQDLLGSGPWLPVSGGTVTGRIITTEGMSATGNTNPSPILKPTTRGFAVTMPEQNADAVILSNDMANLPTFEFRFEKGGSALSAAPVILGGIADPKASYDAVNKRYVDGLVGDIGGLLDALNGEVV